MRRELSMRLAATHHLAVALCGLVLGLGAAGPVLASPAILDPFGGFLDVNLDGLPQVDMNSDSLFLGAGDVTAGTFDVGVEGSMNVCILFGDEVCRTSTLGVTGPYSVISSIEITEVNTPAIDGAFTLFLSGLDAGAYNTSDVQIELDPVAPTGLDASALTNFKFDGTFTPFVKVVYDLFPPDLPFFYVGWQVEVGDIVSFQYDVLTAPGTRGTPPLVANATSNVVPEPGTALLMALGLAGLTAVGQRRTEAGRTETDGRG